MVLSDFANRKRVAQQRIERGYRYGPYELYPAWRIIKHDVEELGNEDYLDQIRRLLGTDQQDQSKLIGLFRKRFGNAEAIWVTLKPEDLLRYMRTESGDYVDEQDFELFEDQIETIEFDNGTVLLEDGDAGYLVLV